MLAIYEMMPPLFFTRKRVLQLHELHGNPEIFHDEFFLLNCEALPGGIMLALEVQRPLNKWSFRKDHCFSRDF